LNHGGPLGWAVVGLVTFLIILLGATFAYWLVSAAFKNKILSEYLHAKSATDSANVLAPNHSNERIDIAQFFQPLLGPTENVRFEHCAIMGPGILFFDGGILSNNNFTNCEIIIAREKIPIRNAIHFKNCTIARSRMIGITFIMAFAAYQKLPEEFKRGVPVISGNVDANNP
jgi:hypothetical protein